MANQTHSKALSEIGVSTFKEDPLVTNIIQPLRGELTVEDVAGYVFLEPDDFKTRLNGTNLSKVLFGALLNDGVVPLQDFAKGYPILIQELILFRDEGQL